MSTFPSKLHDLLDLLMAGSIAGKDRRRQFHNDPESVADNLTPEARGALYSMQRLLITVECGKEYLSELTLEKFARDFPGWQLNFFAYKIPASEFPKAELDAACMAIPVEYPDPTPVVGSVTPNTIASGSGMQRIEVVGQGFVKGKTTIQVLDVDGVTPLAIVPDPPAMTGTFRCGHLKTGFQAPAAAGTCVLHVFIDVGGGSRIEVPKIAAFSEITVT